MIKRTEQFQVIAERERDLLNPMVL